MQLHYEKDSLSAELLQLFAEVLQCIGRMFLFCCHLKPICIILKHHIKHQVQVPKRSPQKN